MYNKNHEYDKKFLRVIANCVLPVQ